MAKLSAGDFINKIRTDENFRKEVGITSSDMPLDQVISRAAAAGFNYTTEDFKTAVESQSLSDNKLDDVSGGVANNWNGVSNRDGNWKGFPAN